MTPTTCPLCYSPLTYYDSNNTSRGLECDEQTNYSSHYYLWHIARPTNKRIIYIDCLYDGDRGFELETIYFKSRKIVSTLTDCSTREDKIIKKWNRKIEFEESILDLVKNFQMLT